MKILLRVRQSISDGHIRIHDGACRASLKYRHYSWKNFVCKAKSFDKFSAFPHSKIAHIIDNSAFRSILRLHPRVCLTFIFHLRIRMNQALTRSFLLHKKWRTRFVKQILPYVNFPVLSLLMTRPSYLCNRSKHPDVFFMMPPCLPEALLPAAHCAPPPFSQRSGNLLWRCHPPCQRSHG